MYTWRNWCFSFLLTIDCWTYCHFIQAYPLVVKPTVGEILALQWIVQGPRAWGVEVAGGGDKTSRQTGLKASVGRRQQRESAPGTQRKGQYAQQGLGRDGWFVEQLVLELSSRLYVQEGDGLAGKPGANSTKGWPMPSASWRPSATFESTQQHHSVQTPNGWVCKRQP